MILSFRGVYAFRAFAVSFTEGNFNTLLGTKIYHLGKRNIIFKIDLSGDKYMLVPRRVTQSLTHWAIIRNIFNNLEARRQTFLDAGIF